MKNSFINGKNNGHSIVGLKKTKNRAVKGDRMGTEQLDKDEDKKISKRSFLKMLTGTVAGVAVALALPTVSKAENTIENINDRFILDNGITYIDSLGRSVVVTQNVQRVIPAGGFAQAILEILCPEKLSAVARSIEPSQQEFYERVGLQCICSLPQTGEVYKTSSISLVNASLQEEADLIIDIGNQKENQELTLENV